MTTLTALTARMPAALSGRWPTLGLVLAALVATLLLAQFVAVLNASVLRGERWRAQQRSGAAVDGLAGPALYAVRAQPRLSAVQAEAESDDASVVP